MIEKLTKTQENKLKEYREKYIKIGLNTDRINTEECIKDIHGIYEKLLGRKKCPVVILDNPLYCWVAVNIFNQVRAQVRDQVSAQVRAQVNGQVNAQVRDQVSAQVRAQVNGQVYDQVYAQVNDQVNAQVYAQVRAQVRDQVNAQVSAQVYAQVRDQVYDQVCAQVNAQVCAQVRDQIISYTTPFLEGCFDSYVFSFYDFFEKELNIKYKQKNKYKIWKKTLKYNQIFCLNNICFVSQKPLEINKNENGLHGEQKPALIYASGLELYYLNGIHVPKWLAMTSKEKIDINKYHNIINTEVKQEFIRKIGLERLLNELDYDKIEEIEAEDLYRQFPITNYLQQGDKIIEPEYEKEMNFKHLTRTFKNNLKNIKYKLLKLDVLGEKRNFLYMINASLKEECHIEGVDDSCNNVFEAICWRNQKQSLPCMLT